MGTPLHIALRYLFAKKTHNVINIISIVSATGIAIGSMALVVILSVYNGFDNSIKQIYESFRADFVVTPAEGKWLEATPRMLNSISLIDGVEGVCPVIEENVFLVYNNRESLAVLKGVGTNYFNWHSSSDNIVEGEIKDWENDTSAIVSTDMLAHNLGMRPRFVAPATIYFPKREGNISIANPTASLNECRFFPTATIRGNTEEHNTVYAHLNTAAALVQATKDSFSYAEIFLHEEANRQKVRLSLEKIFPHAQIKDKTEQNATLYKMMKAEKFAVWLILFFVTSIISINIFGCLSILISDKDEDIRTYMSMGAPAEFIRKVFHLHGFLISVTGCTAGTIAGIILALLQDRFGIVSIPGNYLISAYPVDIQLTDIFIVVAGVLGVGFCISYLPVKKFLKIDATL